MKVKPDPVVLKHFKDGEYHKDYDRKQAVQSFVAFMKDPTGEAPWEEDDGSQDIVHLPDPSVCFNIYLFHHLQMFCIAKCFIFITRALLNCCVKRTKNQS